jgi:propionyl-CoA synthetase
VRWAEEQLGVPVVDHWWQTETGWPIGANCVGLGTLPIKPGSCTKPVPGFDVPVLDEAGFRESYLSRYPGFYLTADADFKDGDGYLWIMSHTDDIINVAGHRLSTGSMEEVLASHPDVAPVVKRLPKTRSGKILRGTIKKIADGTEYRLPSTIEDAGVLDEVKQSLPSRGYPRSRSQA